MKALICDICGGKLKVGTGGIAICDSCGMEHTKERIKEKVVEIKGPVRIDKTHMADNYIELAKRSLIANKYNETENYCNKALEINPNNYEALFLKGSSLVWQIKTNDKKILEATLLFALAIEKSPTKELRESYHTKIIDEFKKMANILISKRGDRFFKWPDNEEVLGFENDIDEIKSSIEKYVDFTGIKINFNDLFREVNLILSTNAVTVHLTSLLSYRNNSESRSSFYKFEEETNLAIRIIQKAIDLCDDDDEVDVKAYEIIISMYESIINNNKQDLISNKWGTYNYVSRLSDNEVNKYKNLIKESNEKIKNKNK